MPMQGISLIWQKNKNEYRISNNEPMNVECRSMEIPLPPFFKGGSGGSDLLIEGLLDTAGIIVIRQTVAKKAQCRSPF